MITGFLKKLESYLGLLPKYHDRGKISLISCKKNRSNSSQAHFFSLICLSCKLYEFEHTDILDYMSFINLSTHSKRQL